MGGIALYFYGVKDFLRFWVPGSGFRVCEWVMVEILRGDLAIALVGLLLFRNDVVNRFRAIIVTFNAGLCIFNPEPLKLESSSSSSSSLVLDNFPSRAPE